MEILDKELCALSRRGIQNKNCHFCAKCGLQFHVPALGLMKTGSYTRSQGMCIFWQGSN